LALLILHIGKHLFLSGGEFHFRRHRLGMILPELTVYNPLLSK
jgi:hypothetical protein